MQRFRSRVFRLVGLLPLWLMSHPMWAQGPGVFAWGWNSSGQLGDGTTTTRSTPVQVNGLTGVTALAGGSFHSLAVKSDGTVWAWGANSLGQLGDGTTTDRSTPVQVNGLAEMTAIAAGRWHSLALKSDGTVWAWGSNSFGRLGDGTVIDRTTPVQVSGLTGVTAIAIGEAHSLAVKSDGTVWAWGLNQFGGLGDGTTTNRLTPVQVTNGVTGLTGVIAIAAGRLHSLALKSDGTVWAWGWNQFGQLGDGTATNRSTPVQVSGLTGVTAIAGAFAHSLALKSDGTVWAWGWNRFGQVGNGTPSDIPVLVPVQVSGLYGVTAIAAAVESGHSLAVKSDGTVWAWGVNLFGQLGDGTTTDHSTPVQVGGLYGVTVIAAGRDHSLAAQAPTAGQAINHLMGMVENGDLGLNGGQANSLLAKLRAALSAAAAGRSATAAHNLQAFINQLNDLVSTSVVTSAAAAPLIWEANVIIGMLS